MRKFLKKLGVLVYAVGALSLTVFVGCSSLMPTRKPPLTDALGYEVWNWKNWTIVGINEAAYNIEVKKLDTWRIMIDVVNTPAKEAHGIIVNWIGIAATGGALGGIPLALKRVPPGYAKKED